MHVLFDPPFGSFKMGEFAFIAAKRRCVVVPTAVYMAGRMCDVEHFVKDDIFDHISRDVCGIERSADRYVLVCSVVMAEYAIGLRG